MSFEYHLYVTCGSGLEPLLLQELENLGLQNLEQGFRGVFVDTDDFSDVYRINYCSRIASRVLFPISQFKCHNQDDLYNWARKIDWFKYIPKGRTFAVDANVTHHSLKNSLYAGLVIKDAICDQFRDKIGTRPSVDVKNPDVQLNLFIRDRKATISIDTSCVPLHKRGYRQEAGEAPLQESLAAALLMIAGYQGTEIVCDPCCGSGTLLIEAALIATQTPPGYLRRDWGFMRLPQFSLTDWLKVKAEADQKRKPLPYQLIFGCDKNKEMMAVCHANLMAAGFAREIEITKSDFRDFEPNPQPNMIICNPPHGKRLESVEQLVSLYRALGDFMKRKIAKPGRGFVFTGSFELSKEIGLAAKKRNVIPYSGVECRFLEFDLY